jgi:acylphosphatase
MASAHGVSGWIRNRDDGTVEAHFEDGDANVDALVQFCRTGPSGADVEHVDVQQVEPEDLSGFEVC